MKWKGTLKAPRLDLDKYRNALHNHLAQQTMEAAKRWFDAIIKQNVVPVWSGASRATFRKLAHLVQYTIPIVPVVPSRIPMGEAASEGYLNVNPKAGKYTFHYSTTLKHLIYNEYNNANLVGFHLITPGPYHFQKKAAGAFWAYAATIRLHSPWDFVKVATLKVR
jgi:hypothetical protein